MARKAKSSYSVWFYILIALGILMITGLLYIPVPIQKPHPEDLSPYIYLLALAAGLFAFFKTRAPHKYLLLPAFALLGFLEEISWGAEWDMFRPFYWNGFKIYDIHNVLPSLFRAARHALGLRFWHIGMLKQFLLVDLGLILLAVACIVVIHRNKKKSAAAIRSAALRTVLVASLVPSILVLARLFTLPSANGLSTARIAIESLNVLAIASATWAAIRLGDKKSAARWPAKIDRWLAPLSRRAASWLLAVILFLGLVYQIFAATRSLVIERAVLFDRLNPLALWLFAIGLLFMILIYAWQQRYPHPTAAVPRPNLGFFVRNPAFIFALFAVLWLLLAQLIDRGAIILRPDWPDFWIRDWGLWIEELLEMTSAVELLAAAFFFSHRRAN